MSIIKMISVLLFAAILVSGCGDVVSNPPVTVEVKYGLTTDNVIYIHNTSTHKISGFLNVQSKNGQSSARARFIINANDYKSFGTFDFTPIWRAKSGESGHISVDGYSRVLKFHLKKSSYSWEFGYP